MNFDIDGGKLLYALGVLFALGALLYFVRDVVFGLSITVKAALLLVAFVALLVAGLSLGRDVLDVVAYAVAALSYAVFLGYVTTRYGLDETGVFLLLAGSAALFVGLGYGVRQELLAVERRTAGYIVIGLLAVSLVLVGADVLTGDVQYTADLETETTIQLSEADAAAEHSQLGASVGTLTVRNPSPFTRPASLPSVHGCLLGADAPEDRVFVEYDPDDYDVSNRIGGGAERTHEIAVEIPVATNATGERTYAIERRPDCNVTREEPTLVVVFDDLDG